MLHDKTSWVKAGGKREEQWPAMEIVLEHGEFRLALMPLLGGSVRSFSWAGVDILRPAQAGSEASQGLRHRVWMSRATGDIDHR